MTKEWLCTGETGDIVAFIAKCNFPDDAYFLGEQQPAQVVKPEERQDLLLFVDFQPTLPFAEYTSGRIFHREFELRWQPDNGRIRVVYLGTPAYCPFPSSERVQIDMQQQRQFYLFGERLRPGDVEMIGAPVREGDFAEVRIPRLLRYPVPGNQRRVLVTISESINEQTGEVKQYRFQGVEGGE